MRMTPIVYRATASILALGLSGLAAGQSLLHPETLPRMKAGPPVTYGTSQDSYITVSEAEFAPASSQASYDDFGNNGTNNLLRYETAGHTFFVANVHLPGGAVVQSVEFDLCDSSVANEHVQFAILSCGSIDGLCTQLGTTGLTTSNAGNPCAAYNVDLTGLNYVMDNTANRFHLDLIPSATDNTNAFAGAKVLYRLQVSPAPAMADFADVPTSHPFFQFVEALLHSGITAGCGGGNFCPDNPLTRGQMAVFLSKALGLQFP